MNTCLCQEVEEGKAKRCPLHHRYPCCMGSAVYGRHRCTCRRERTSVRHCPTCRCGTQSRPRRPRNRPQVPREARR